MATSSSSNRARLTYAKETIYGQKPTTGTTKTVRMTGESLNLSKTTEVSEEIRDNRQVADLILLDMAVAGDINHEMSAESFDDLIAAVMCNTWTVDGSDPNKHTITNGTVPSSYTFEKAFLDINQFLTFMGVSINTWNLDINSKARITGAFGVMGATSERAAVTGLPAPVTPPSLTEPMNSVRGIGQITLDGAVVPCGVSSLSFNINNNLRTKDALGKMGTCELLQGTFELTGEIALYFEDGAIYDKYVDHDDLTLSWELTDPAGNKYAFRVPRLKLTDGTIVAGSRDENILATFPWQGLESAEGITIEIIRTTV